MWVPWGLAFSDFLVEVNCAYREHMDMSRVGGQLAGMQRFWSHLPVLYSN